MFENVPKGIFGSKKEEVVGWWEAGGHCIMRNFVTCMLHQMLLGDQIKEDEMDGACSMYGRGEKYNILVGKPEGKRPLGRSRHRWEDNIRLYHREIGQEGVDWLHPTLDRDWWWVLVNTVMNLQVP
jgi:hypothetical protein